VECMWFNIVFYKNFKKVFKLIFFNIFRLFWYDNIKNKF
jgi:hypothetical protein